MSCVTGIVEEGCTVMIPQRILRAYFRSWFFLDIIVVGPDWVFTLMDLAGGSDTDNSTGASKLLRVLRVVRTVRLLRLAKLQRILALAKDKIETELAFILASI